MTRVIARCLGSLTVQVSVRTESLRPDVVDRAMISVQDAQ